MNATDTKTAAAILLEKGVPYFQESTNLDAEAILSIGRRLLDTTTAGLINAAAAAFEAASKAESEAYAAMIKAGNASNAEYTEARERYDDARAAEQAASGFKWQAEQAFIKRFKRAIEAAH